ncbi:MAG TPA: di-heme oxidoredictase family protein [Chthoniobacterales bacterium]|nr:di-heme oxidoredictase family protein [Chthoniobacterales bacterium]
MDIDQQKLLEGKYAVGDVLQKGGQFWTTPFTRYNATTKIGDGYGEGGANAPRAAQRKAFNPSGFPTYPFLRLNGLDSQSCYECHNSIGSAAGYGAGSPLIRKQPSSVGGSAGSNSNAFINPCFPNPATLFIRQPPHVFGSGYVQTIAEEITSELYALRAQARTLAQASPGKAQSIPLLDTKHNLDYGTFTTTYTAPPPGKPPQRWVGLKNQSTCAVPLFPCAPPKEQTSNASKASPAQSKTAPKAPSDVSNAAVNNDIGAIMQPGFTDDLSQIKGVSSDLIVRPFQWKGISSSIRHFVEGALDFHFSMQPAETVPDCDCDKDGKINEVSVGNVSAISAFVGMTRPPQQIVPPGISQDSVQRGYQIFTGTARDLKLPQQMCATCHTPALPITDPNPQFTVDGPEPDPNFNCPDSCPGETAAYSGSLINPRPSHARLAVLKRIKAAPAALRAAAAPTTYNIPLNSAAVPASSLPRLTQTAPFFLPFLPQPPAGALYVPLFSDLHTHDMGVGLVDLGNQPTDVATVCVQPRFFMTRPLWGVADTGPWLHDGRATSLMEAIVLHGDSSVPNPANRSEAAPVIDAFQKLSPDDQQAIVNFLLSLRLPVEENSSLVTSR